MRVLIDTNVLIDFTAMRKPFYEHALRIIDACDRKIIHGSLAAHSVPNIYYILRKDIPAPDRREILKALCEILTVESLDYSKIVNALCDDSFPDFEDCLQNQCAAYFSADFIITRDIHDFASSSIPAIEPENFCERFLNTEER